MKEFVLTLFTILVIVFLGFIAFRLNITTSNYLEKRHDDKKEVAKVLGAEACSEGRLGMYLVANTIENRAYLTGNNYVGIVKEPSQYFGFTNPNKESIYETCKRDADKVASQLFDGKLLDLTDGATCFLKHGEQVKAWHKRKTIEYKNHIFYECM